MAQAAAPLGLILVFAGNRPWRLQGRGGNATIPRTVSISRTPHRLLVLALPAWMSLCCCEKRILAHALESADAAPRACCADDCCSGGERGGDQQDHPRNCSDGCCVKSCAAAPAFVPALDAIGTDIPLLSAPAADDVGCGRTLSHEDRTAGEPPPRLALVISRRLRI